MIETFGQALRRFRERAGLSQPALARRMYLSQATISRIESGKQAVDESVADRLDEVLDAGGALRARLGAVAVPSGVLTPDDVERLGHVADKPRRVDHGALGSMAVMLAEMRRLEDTIGAAPLVEPIHGHLRLVESLVLDARGPIRPDVVGQAAQWAQFAGWLHTATDSHTVARRCHDQATEWALEAGDANMVATALSLKGYSAWKLNQLGPMVGLSSAAGCQPGISPGLRAMAAQQEARAYALLGDAGATDRKLDEAVELVGRAAGHPDDEPPWIYFYSPDYVQMQRGRAYRFLGRDEEAAELLAAGLGALPADVRGAEWAASYRHDLDVVRALCG